MQRLSQPGLTNRLVFISFSTIHIQFRAENSLIEVGKSNRFKRMTHRVSPQPMQGVAYVLSAEMAAPVDNTDLAAFALQLPLRNEKTIRTCLHVVRSSEH